MIRLVVLLAGGCAVKQAQEHALAHPNDPAAWEALGDAWRGQLRHGRASEAYREAMRLDPERSYLGDRLARSREATRLRRAAMIAMSDDERWGDLADQLVIDGDEAGAHEAYRRAFHLDPVDSEWQRALVDRGDQALVLERARESLELGDDESLGDYADVLDLVGEPQEACAYWARALALDPTDEEWLGHAEACGYGEGGDGDAAEGGSGPQLEDPAMLRAALSRDVRLLVRLGQAYLKAGDRAMAEQTLWGALLVAPTDADATWSYLAATGSTRHALLDRLRRSLPDDDEVVGALADHLLELGLRDDARVLYDRARALDEDDPRWKNRQALLP